MTCTVVVNQTNNAAITRAKALLIIIGNPSMRTNSSWCLACATSSHRPCERIWKSPE